MTATAPPKWMRAAKKSGTEKAAVIEVPTPAPGPGEVLIAVKTCAICASDFEGWLAAPGEEEVPGDWNPNNPGLTGHEISGEVAALGPGVGDERLGERVWLDAITGCGSCDVCESGRQVLCPRVRVNSQGFAEYIVAPARQCHPLPATIDFVTGSLLFDMVGTPFGAALRAGIGGGESVAVWGLGPVGLGMVQAARILGAANITGIDPITSRRKTALGLGATLTIDPSSADPVALLQETTGGGADVVLCTVASPEGAQQAFDATRLDGRLITVAGFPPAGGDTAKWVSGSWVCYDRDWPTIIQHVIAGRFTLDPYVTHTYPLDQIEEAFRVRLHDPEHSLKVVITLDQEHTQDRSRPT